MGCPGFFIRFGGFLFLTACEFLDVLLGNVWKRAEFYPFLYLDPRQEIETLCSNPMLFTIFSSFLRENRKNHFSITKEILQELSSKTTNTNLEECLRNGTGLFLARLKKDIAFYCLPTQNGSLPLKILFVIVHLF